MVVVVISVDVVVNDVDFVVMMLILLLSCLLMFLFATYILHVHCTGLTSRWGCWTRRRWSSSTSPLSRSSSSSVSTLALS